VSCEKSEAAGVRCSSAAAAGDDAAEAAIGGGGSGVGDVGASILCGGTVVGVDAGVVAGVVAVLLLVSGVVAMLLVVAGVVTAGISVVFAADVLAASNPLRREWALILVADGEDTFRRVAAGFETAPSCEAARLTISRSADTGSGSRRGRPMR